MLHFNNGLPVNITETGLKKTHKKPLY